MNKRIYLSASLLALLALGCNKAEIDTPEEAPETPAVERAYLKAEILNSKTDYDISGHFSWAASDQISVVLWNDGTAEPAKLNELSHYVYDNTTGAGTTATFGGSAISSPLNEFGVALYPSTDVSAYNGIAEAGSKTDFQVTVQQEIRPDLDNPMSVIPLIGRKNGEGVYQFETAMGVLQVTVTDIPLDAYYLYLYIPDDSYHCCGTFAVGDKNEICSADFVSGSSYYKKTIAFTPQIAGETRTFYFPLPTGTLPIGTELRLDKGYAGGFANIMTKTFSKAVTITANHVTPLKAVAAETWEDIEGTGKFMDDNGFYRTGFYSRSKGIADYVSVTIQKNKNDATRYRVVNPYQAYVDQKISSEAMASDPIGPDPYFYFTLKDGFVSFDTYHTGLKYDYLSDGDTHGEFYLDDPNAYGFNKWNNCVIQYDLDGVSPLNVQLSPFYFYDGSSSYYLCHENPKIEIVFPGSTRMLECNNYPNYSTVACTQGEVSVTLGSGATAIKVVAASDLAAGVATLKANGAGVLTFNSSGLQYFVGLAGGTYRLVYMIETDGHGVTFKDGGSFTMSDLETNQIRLYPSMISVNVDAGKKDGSSHYDGSGKNALVDGNTATFWHTPWESKDDTYYNWSDLDGTYGAYIDVDLGANTVTDFTFHACLRAAYSDFPKHIKIYSSADHSTWTELADVANICSGIAAGSWITPIPCSGASARYIRFSILTNTSEVDLTDPSKQGCTHLAEIKVFDDSI